MSQHDGNGSNGPVAGDLQKAGVGSSLPPIAVSRAMLATATGRRKLDVIFNSSDPKAFVRRLPAEDLYFALKEVGLTDTTEVIGLASPQQFRSFVDLDAWEGYSPDPSRVLLWLRLAREGASQSGDFRRKRGVLDPEVIVLVLKTKTVIHPLEEGDDPVLSSDNFLRTAEGKYLIEIMAEGDDGVTTRHLLEDFIDEDPFTATRLFEAVRWEIASELEENAHRWREGRLRDMGFPSIEEAIRVWTPLPKGWTPREAAVAPGPVAGVPALLLATSRAPLLLDRVVERLPDESRPFFNEGLVYLLNCALVADGIEPRDIDLSRESLAATRDMLSLGLELASDGDEELALRIAGTTPASELFRLAVTHVLELSREATAAGRRLAYGQGTGNILDTPDSETLTGLRRKRPRLFDPPVAGGPPKPQAQLWRALRDRTDLERARAVIARANAVADLLGALGLNQETVQRIADESGRTVSALTIGPLAISALLREALSGVSAPESVWSPEDVAGIRGLFEDARLSTDARQRIDAIVARWQEQVPPVSRDALAVLASGWVSRLEDELGGPIAAGELDPRYVDVLLVRAAG